MPLHELTDDERHSHCRREIKALELWLRRLVHETFSKTYGAEYLNAAGKDGNPLFKKKTIEAIEGRRRNEPSRYARPIDAATLGDLVGAICTRENYDRHFGEALRGAFPEGHPEARTFLNRVVDIRNKVSHANPISVHDAIRAICYSQDVIASLKEHYAAMNQQRDYDVPTIIRVADSLGNVRHESELGPRLGMRDFRDGASGRLYPGDRLAIEVEVDPTFERSSYWLQWRWRLMKLAHPMDTERVVIEIDTSHVGDPFDVVCQITSNKPWHRGGDYDDRVELRYKVLPPPE
jgi:hypothetical protein